MGEIIFTVEIRNVEDKEVSAKIKDAKKKIAEISGTKLTNIIYKEETTEQE